MSSMIDLIRASAVPSNIVQSAAKGSLAIPAPEMIEILVHLALHSKVFSEQASLTLAGWSEGSSLAVASNPHSPKEVLDYMIAPKNLRPVLLPALVENLSVSETAIAELAASASREAIEVLLNSARVNQSSAILTALNVNPGMSEIQVETVKSKLAQLEPETQASPAEQPAAAETEEVLPVLAPEATHGSDQVLDKEITTYLTEHAAEITAEEDKPFQPIGGIHDEMPGSEEPLAETASAAAAGAGSAGAGTGSARKTSPARKTFLTAEESKGSALQKISRLDVKGRIQLAMKGNKEERSILVRDGTKVVALAVLDSPKLTDSEAEMFASQKNVLESLLRGISMKRRFLKHYPIVRNLVSNPRTPLDVSLTMMKGLLVNDLKNLSGNKDVSDTIRKLALKMYKQKRDSTGKR